MPESKYSFFPNSETLMPSCSQSASMARYEVYVKPSLSKTGLYFRINPFEQAYSAKPTSLSNFKSSSFARSIC